jgi:hypothetical protein
MSKKAEGDIFGLIAGGRITASINVDKHGADW